MTIHDELVLELIKPDRWGKPTGYIIKIVGTSNIKYKLEQLVYDVRRLSSRTESVLEAMFERPVTKIIVEEMAPDIIVKRLKPDSKEKELVVIELETDVDFDFGKSLRQIKKYVKRFKEVIIIIPNKYERFAILYKNEGFPVYLWKATRIWECMQCGNEMEEERIVKPGCSSCKSREQTLKGLKDVVFKLFEEGK